VLLQHGVDSITELKNRSRKYRRYSYCHDKQYCRKSNYRRI